LSTIPVNVEPPSNAPALAVEAAAIPVGAATPATDAAPEVVAVDAAAAISDPASPAAPAPIATASRAPTRYFTSGGNVGCSSPPCKASLNKGESPSCSNQRRGSVMFFSLSDFDRGASTFDSQSQRWLTRR
jgi:hypothetical protein